MLSDEDMRKAFGSFKPDFTSPLISGRPTNPFPKHTDPMDATSISALHDQMLQQMAVRRRESAQLDAFKESYIKIRSANVALDHHTAIALVKMISQDADRLTLEDFA